MRRSDFFTGHHEGVEVQPLGSMKAPLTEDIVLFQRRRIWDTLRLFHTCHSASFVLKLPAPLCAPVAFCNV